MVEEVLFQLKSKHRCKVHPTDKKAIVIYGITLKQFEEVCKKYCCSGFWNEQENIGVATNFGYYK